VVGVRFLKVCVFFFSLLFVSNRCLLYFVWLCRINEGWIIRTVLYDTKITNKSPEVCHI
jgi:hypothetical protein